LTIKTQQYLTPLLGTNKIFGFTMTQILTSEHPAVAHRPALVPHQQYVQWTQHHQNQAQGLPPCAIHFWQYLLHKYPGGVPQEIDLSEIRFELSQGRSKIYCVQSLKNALWKYLVPKGLVQVVKQFTKRIMRVIANHAGPVKEIEKKVGSPKFNLHSPKQIWESESETLMTPFSIQRNTENPQTPDESGCCDNERLEEIRAAIANAPFMQDVDEPESLPPIEPVVESKFSAPIARTILDRLRHLDISPATEVRSLVAKTPEVQLERNISALEEEAATKGLKSPIAAFKYFVIHNCQPRNDRQAWWNKAAAALGKQQRDRLIQSVTEYAGEVVVMFTNGRRLALTQAQGMTWEVITALGEMP